MKPVYRVLLLVAKPLTIADFSIWIHGIEYPIKFETACGLGVSANYDLIVTDKGATEVANDPCIHGFRSTSIVVYSNPSFADQDRFETIFSRSKVKFKKASVSERALKRIVSAEMVKHLALKRAVTKRFLLVCQYTRHEFWKKSGAEMGLLLGTFCLILIYYVARNIGSWFDCHIAFLTWFVDYQPDSDKDIVSDLRLVTLWYSLINLAVYYSFVIKLFEAIGTDGLYSSAFRRCFHRFCQWTSPVLLFTSGLIIVKELFVLKHGQAIAQEFGFIDIGKVFDRRIPFLKEEFLIFYFVAIDLVLWLMTLNAIRALNHLSISGTDMTLNRRSVLTSASRSAGFSWVFDVTILLITWFALNPLMPDPQSRLVVQLILLQGFYLYVNLSIVVTEFIDE